MNYGLDFLEQFYALIFQSYFKSIYLNIFWLICKSKLFYSIGRSIHNNKTIEGHSSLEVFSNCSHPATDSKLLYWCIYEKWKFGLVYNLYYDDFSYFRLEVRNFCFAILYCKDIRRFTAAKNSHRVALGAFSRGTDMEKEMH